MHIAMLPQLVSLPQVRDHVDLWAPVGHVELRADSTHDATKNTRNRMPRFMGVVYSQIDKKKLDTLMWGCAVGVVGFMNEFAGRARGFGPGGAVLWP